jgi:hypothetical protein
MRHHRRAAVLTVLAFATAALHSAGGARAGMLPYTVNSGQGNGAETYVRGGTFADDNYGSALPLLASNAGADLSQASKVYVRFDLSQVSGWNGVGYNASVSIPFQDSGIGTTPRLMDWNFTLYALTDGPADLWDESTIDWGNAPGNDPTSATGVGAGTTLIMPFSVQGMGSLIMFYSAAIDQLLTDDTNNLVTFIIVRETAAAPGADYVHAVAAPQEAFTGPTLTVPEPAGAVLLACACGALSLRRRRNIAEN